MTTRLAASDATLISMLSRHQNKPTNNPNTSNQRRQLQDSTRPGTCHHCTRTDRYTNN